ncbi:MAG: hydantoinase/oxoprolinase family protein [Bacillota bacterium]
MDFERGEAMFLGLDMGGTHVDGVIIDQGRVVKTVKNPTDRDDLFFSVWTTLQELIQGVEPEDIKRINLSTTVSTNAIVENKMEAVGMIIQSGPGLPQEFLACGEENLFISGYVDHRGKAVKGIKEAEVLAGVKMFQKASIKNCAVVTKFSPRNASQELKIKELIKNDFSTITLGHRLSGKLNFPRRVFTSYLNAAVGNSFQSFVRNLSKSLDKVGISAPVYILKADGGTMDLATASAQPVETILSGPAASLMGLTALLPVKGDGVLLDIGGTTTDFFFLADGVPLFEPLGSIIGGYKTLVRSIYSRSIGLGGDSSLQIEQGELKIGPQRAGKPLALGGIEATPTDAMIVLGQLTMGDSAKSIQGLQVLGEKLGLGPQQMATAVLEKMGEIIKEELLVLLEKINSKPVYTIRELLYGKKIVPKELGLIGGPAKSLAPVLGEKLKLPCFYPKHFPVANAIGAALAKVTTEVTLLADTELGSLRVAETAYYEKINKGYTLEKAVQQAKALLQEKAATLGEEGKVEAEITEAESFNMVRGFSAGGKNIRVKAQITPGLLYSLRGEAND